MTSAPVASTLLLDTVAWDLCLDARGNWALAAPPYATVQSVASACQLFLGELYFDTSKGVPFYQDVFGAAYPLALLKSDLVAAAESVPGVLSATVFLDVANNREVTGQVQVETAAGTFLVGL